MLVPLASWIFLLALMGYIAYAASTSRTRRDSAESWHKLIYRKRTSDTALLQTAGAEETSSEQKVTTSAMYTTKWPKTSTFFAILYSLLVLATLLMSECAKIGQSGGREQQVAVLTHALQCGPDILEIVRLYLADRDAGLLPFSLASLLIILILMHIPLPRRLRPATGAVIVVFWLFSLVFTAVQLATLVHLQNIEPRAQTEYLNSDQIIDVSVIVALVSALGSLCRPRRRGIIADGCFPGSQTVRRRIGGGLLSRCAGIPSQSLAALDDAALYHNLCLMKSYIPNGDALSEGLARADALQ